MVSWVCVPTQERGNEVKATGLWGFDLQGEGNYFFYHRGRRGARRKPENREKLPANEPEQVITRAGV